MTGRPRAASANVLLEALAACRTAFVAVAGFSAAINLLMLTLPLYMLQVYDRVLTSRSTDTLLLLTVITIAALAVFAILESVRGHLMVQIGGWLDRRLGGDILSGSVARSLRSSGDPSVQGLRDLTTFRTFLTGPTMFPVLDSPWSPVFAGLIFTLHPLLGVLAVCGAAILFGLAVVNELASRAPLQQANGLAIRNLNQAEAAARNADAIHAMGMMPGLVARWRARAAEVETLQAAASLQSGRITAASKFMRMALQVGMLGVGAWLAILGEITPGAMIAGSILMGRALAPVEQAIGSWKQMVTARGAYRRLQEQFAATPPRGETMTLPVAEGRLDVEGVTFAHPGTTEPTIRNVAFALAPGESLGLIGPSASGKTTLARLLVGNLAPRAGTVRLDGADIASWPSAERGPYVGYLPQDVELFADTVQENIARMTEADPADVIAAAKLAGVHEMILRLPKGYDTEIGEGGAALSGGQRQRIALARALFGGPKLIVLDEPNASLDHAGEEALLVALEALRAQRATVVVIAHRPSVLRHVDKILVLRDGTVQTFGPRDEVIPRVTGPGARQRIAAPGDAGLPASATGAPPAGTGSGAAGD
jgi:PrtD family type I secretion system ABC transporter